MSRGPAFKPVMEMEGMVVDVERWGDALIAIGTTDANVSPGVVLVIGWALKRLGDDLESQWRDAFKAAGGDS